MIGRHGIARFGGGRIGYGSVGGALTDGANQTIPPFRFDALQLLLGGFDAATNEVTDSRGLLDEAKYVNSPCLTFSGGQYVTFPFNGVHLPSCTISAYVKFDSVVSTRCLWAYGTDRYRLFVSEGILRVNTGENTLIPVSTGVWYFITQTFDSAGYCTDLSVKNLTTENTDYWSGSAPFSAESTGDSFLIGSRFLTTYGIFFNGSISGFKITNLTTGQVYLEAPLSEGWGSVAYNQVIVGNHGAMVNFTLATAWGQTQNDYHDAIMNGFTLYEHATDPFICVPFSTAGVPLVITPPTGYTKTGDYPAGSVLPPCYTEIEQTDSYFDDNTPNFWHDGSYVPISNAEAQAHYNSGNGSQNLWIKMAGLEVVDICQFPIDKNWTPSQVARLERWFGGTSGALTDDGEYVTDDDGFVIFGG